MNENSLVSELLKENFSTECETVGPTNLQDIAEAQVSFTPSASGAYMDFGEAIGILVVATSFIKNVLDIYVALKKELKRKPRKDEVKDQTTRQTKSYSLLDDLTRERLLIAIIRKLDDQ